MQGPLICVYYCFYFGTFFHFHSLTFSCLADFFGALCRSLFWHLHDSQFFITFLVPRFFDFLMTSYFFLYFFDCFTFFMFFLCIGYIFCFFWIWYLYVCFNSLEFVFVYLFCIVVLLFIFSWALFRSQQQSSFPTSLVAHCHSSSSKAGSTLPKCSCKVKTL